MYYSYIEALNLTIINLILIADGNLFSSDVARKSCLGGLQNQARLIIMKVIGWRYCGTRLG